MKTNPRFNQKLLPSLIAAVAMAGFQVQAHAEDATEEVVVTGVRAAQERAIDIKKNSSEVVDAISAEDIGKLPDATISDSLQRVTGIQIQRSAGQGGLVSIRGTREIMTTLNGELFLTADNILNSQANYQSIPSSLISGSNVYKSMSSKNLEGGIGGSVDLLTRRSLSAEQGLKTAVRVQASQGSITETTDPDVNGFVTYNWDDSVAMSLGVAYSEQTVSDNEVSTKAADNVQDEASWAGNKDFNGDGDTNDRFLIMSNWDGPRLYKNDTERERLGLTYNFNSKLGDNFELNFDSFYNKMDENASGNYVYLGDETVDYDRSRIIGLTNIQSTGNPKMDSKFYTTGWTKLMDGSIRGGVNSNYRDTSALNNSLELKYDAGGALTGSARYVKSKAYKNSSDLILAQKADSPEGAKGLPYNIAGDTRVVNPGFIDDRGAVSFLANKENVSVNFDQGFAKKLVDPAAWYFHSSWLEGERQDVDLEVIRADGNYKFAESGEGIKSVDFGVRSSQRTAVRDQFHYFMPTSLIAYDPDSKDTKNKEYQMLVKYHEAGYTIGKVKEGHLQNYRVAIDPKNKNPATDPKITFEPVRGVNLDEDYLKQYLTNVSDFGAAVASFNAVIPMVDASKIGDHKAFMDGLYNVNHVKLQRPHRSYDILESRSSFYVNTNFDTEVSDRLTIAGNAGVRRITDTIRVIKNTTDGTKAPNIIAGADHNHTILRDTGDESVYVDHSYFLPSLNVNLSLDEMYKIKFSYDERMSLQSLNNFGEGSETSYDSQKQLPNGSWYQPIGTIKEGGNPNLDSWSANVYNLGFEVYPNEDTLLGATFFYMDIGGFTDTETSLLPQAADTDGVVRNGAKYERLINGKNASIKGLELSYQQSFTFLPSFLSNTGITWNFTYSPSEKKGKTLQYDGSQIPFNETAEKQSNLVLWYNDEMFEFRLAANYLSKKYDGQMNAWTLSPLNGDNEKGLVGGLDKWEDDTIYVDLGGTFHVNEMIDVSLNVQNLTEEGSYKYLHWEDFRSEYYAFERRINLGASAKF